MSDKNNTTPNADDLHPSRQVVIIGAGPAGLTAAYDITKHSLRPLVIEKLDKVGGIARTENYRGYYFDMGGHRFFTKSAIVNQFWNEVLGEEFLLRPRLSRIYYNRKFFLYPLKPMNALSGLGLWQSILVGLSYIRWQLFPYRRETTFEQWVTNRFGSRLFRIFFKAYTEKVWGISTSELNAEWAAQRIKDLDLKAAVLSMFVKPKQSIKTLIEEFHYPKRGPGMLWNKVKETVEERGGEVWLNTNVCGITRAGDRITGLNVSRAENHFFVPGSDFISSMPITEFIFKLNPPAPDDILEAAKHLTYRDFLTVCLIINKEQLFADNWIYVHDPAVKVGRIQNFKNWSPFMVPDAAKTSLGLEYFCNEGDSLWNSSDAELIELGKREIEQIGLAQSADVIDGVVYRVEKSYPVYDSNYQIHLEKIRKYIARFQNFQTIGRNGLHRYNNQDHAMLTGMLAVRNILNGEKNNLWVVNAEQEYHEEIREERKPDLDKIADDVFARAFMKMDAIAFGTAAGLTGGLLLFLSTLMFAGKDELEVSRFLWLLSNYLPFYKVTFANSWIGLVYGFLIGFVLGWFIASLRNATIRIYVSILRRRIERTVMDKSGFLPDVQSQSAFESEMVDDRERGKDGQ